VTTNLLIANFDLLAEAPNGVQRLRELILQLAVQGKLVPQDPNDEPASALLERSHSDKVKLIAEGEIPKGESLPLATPAKIAYELPTGWVWTKLDQVSNKIHYGYTASADPILRDVRLLRITDIQNGTVDWTSVPGCEISQEEYENYRLGKGDLLIARTGGTIGKSYLVKDLPVKAVFASYLIRVIPKRHFSPEYLKIFLESPLYWSQLYAKSMGTGQPNVSGTSLRSLLIPIPPADEQRRIVAKADELMIRCDELQKRQKEKEQVRVTLNDSALTHLVEARDPKEFATHWKRIKENFELLYDTPETVPKLRQTILQLAVQGKLVPQDPNDEPASTLLQRIRAEKEELIAKRKVWKAESLPAIKPDEIPYKLPRGWTWCRLGEIGNTRVGLTYSPKDVAKTGVPVLRANNIRNGKIDLGGVVRVNMEIDDNLAIKVGDILICTRSGSRALVGKAASVISLPERMTFGAFMAIFRSVCNPFVEIFLRSPVFGKVLDEVGTTTINQITQSNLKGSLFPLPPLPEQHRIVARAKHVLGLCEDLEVKLAGAEKASEELMGAVVREVAGA